MLTSKRNLTFKDHSVFMLIIFFVIDKMFLKNLIKIKNMYIYIKNIESRSLLIKEPRLTILFLLGFIQRKSKIRNEHSFGKSIAKTENKSEC